MSEGFLARLVHVVVAGAIGAATIVALIGFRYAEAPWLQDRDTLLYGALMAAAFVVGLAIHRLLVPRQIGFVKRVILIVLIAALVCLPVLALTRLQDLDVRKLTYVVELALVFALMLFHGIGYLKWPAVLVNLAALVAIAVVVMDAPAREKLNDLLAGGPKDKAPAYTYVYSSLHDIRLTKDIVPQASGSPKNDVGGALVQIGPEKLLLVSANGEFYVLKVTKTGVTRQALKRPKTPLNRTEYMRDVRHASQFFRVTDIELARDGDGDIVLLIAHHRWHADKGCVTLSVSEAPIDLAALDTPLQWRYIYESTPCITPEIRILNETGGRLAMLPNGEVLLTVGVTSTDEGFTELSKNANSVYGTVVAVDRTNGNARIFSRGHRNHQGLLVDGDTIWSTEHGPDGGDELNIVVDGGDYGWPKVSYGTDYGAKSLFGDGTPGKHDYGIRPLYAWVPSIAVSRLIRARGAAFRGWKGDLLIGSLSGRGNGFSIYRVRVRDGSVKFAERVNIGERVRDLVEMDDGTIVAWDGQDRVMTLRPGTQVFAACRGCHGTNLGFPSIGIGPDLWGIVGKDVAAVKGFNYSKAFRNLGGRWTPERLDQFLRDPEGFAPGTTMTMPGIEDETLRRDIINYLVELPRSRTRDTKRK